MPERVLAPIYPGETCKAVVDRAVELTDPGGELILAHIVDKSFLSELPGASRAPDSTLEGMKNLGRRMLEREAERVGDRGFEVRTLLRHGALVKEIIDLIHEHEVDLLVVGAHKHQFIEAHEEYEWDEVREETGVRIETVPTSTS